MMSILIGSIIGLLIRAHLNQEYRKVVFASVGIITLVLGVMMMFPTQHIIYLTLALTLGGLIGSVVRLEQKIENLGGLLYRAVRRVVKPKGTQEGIGAQAQVFLETSVLFCSGSLAILGSFQAGADNNLQLLLLKSMLDGLVAIFFAALLGPGVILSIFSVLVYQGTFVLLGMLAGTIITPEISTELGAVGGALLVMIGLRLLDLRQDLVGNFLPALLVMGLLLAVTPLLRSIGSWVIKLTEFL